MNCIMSSKTSAEELKKKLLPLKPTIDEISKQRGRPFKDFQPQVQDSLQLVKKLEGMSSFDLYRRYRYEKKILKVEKNVNNFLLTQRLANLILDVHNRNVDLMGCIERTARVEEMGRHIIESVNAKITNDSSFNSLLLQQIDASFNSLLLLQMSITEFFQSSIDGLNDTPMAEQFTSCCNSQVPGIPSFVVGLNNLVNDVKQILFQNEVNILGVEGMGGSGKTTLALALCNDLHVKDFFQNNVVFITVSQSPNAKALLETMWDRIIGTPRPVFQSIEDAHNQLQKNLSLKGNPQTLVVLDDVWSRSHVEQLLFEAEGCQTVITTRQC